MGDVIDGGAGTDKFEIYGNGNANNFDKVSVKNVEQVYAQLAGGATGTIDVSKNADVKEAWLSNNTSGANTVTLTKAQVGGLQGNTGTTATFAFSNATAATGDEATIALNAATLTTGLTVNAIETLNLAATGKNSVGTLAGNSISKLVVTGDGVTATAAGGGSFKTIDASAAKGDVSLNISGVAATDHTITTGAGNDTLTINGTNLTNADTIDLGAGRDKLISTTVLTLNSATAVAALSKVSNVEVIGTSGATLTVDGDFLTTYNTFATSGTGNVVLTNLTQGAGIEFGAGALTGSTAAMKVGAANTTLNVELAGSTTAASDLSAGLAVSGTSTINLVSKGTAGVAANQLALTAAGNQNVVVSGAQDLTLTTAAAAGATTGFTIDGSAATGKLNATGTAQIDVLIGGSAADTLNGGGNLAVTAVAEVQTIDFNGVSVAAGGTIVVNYNGTDYTYTNATAGAVADGALATAVAAVVLPTTATATAATTVVTIAQTAGNEAPIAQSTVTGTLVTGAPVAATTTDGVAPVAAVAFTADTYTGNGGADTFVVGTADAAAASSADVITDFATSVDKIDFAKYDIAGTLANYKEGTAAVADFAAALAAADAHFAADTTVVYSAQQVGSDTFLFAATAAGTTATDVVKLTGVGLDGIGFADIVA